MIAKITRGQRVRDLAVYLHGPGRREEHVHAGRSGGAVIGGNLCLEGSRSPDAWAQVLGDAARVRPEINRPIWHASLRCAPGDRVLTDAQWAQAAGVFAEAMGFVDPPGAESERAAQPWVVVRHGQDHVHIAVSRVGLDGRVWHGRQDYRRAQAACAQLEELYGLSVAPRSSTVQTQRVADHQVRAGEWRRGQRTGATPERVELAQRVRAALEVAAGGGREGFERALGVAQVTHRVNAAANGRISGYSFALPGHRDKGGEVVWFRASQLDRALSWSKVAPVLDGPPVPVAVKVEKKRLETRGHHGRRVAQAQAAAGARRNEQQLQDLPHVIAARAQADQRWWQGRRFSGEAAGAGARNRVAVEKSIEQSRQAWAAPSKGASARSLAAAVAARERARRAGQESGPGEPDLPPRARPRSGPGPGALSSRPPAHRGPIRATYPLGSTPCGQRDPTLRPHTART